MHRVHAHALRRAATAGAILAATLSAHAAGTSGGAITLRTPFMVCAVLAGSVLVGRRTADFRPRSPARVLLSLVLMQALAHLALVQAPWLLGLSVHCQTPVASASMIACHAIAALVLTLALTRLERMLALAVAVLRTVRRLLAGRPARPASWRSEHDNHVPPLRSAPRGTTSARGPPLLFALT